MLGVLSVRSLTIVLIVCSKRVLFLVAEGLAFAYRSDCLADDSYILVCEQ